MPGSALLRTLGVLAVAALVVAAPSTVRAQQPAGATLSPDLQSYMVNKDIGPERWSITLNLYAQDPSSIIGITGNIFRTGGGPASFVTCLERFDSTGDLREPTSIFRLACSGASACSSTAEACARTGWTSIADDVRVPASFFLPPGGNPAADADALATAPAVRSPRSAHAQADAGRGATLTIDRLNHLVTKDVGSERWAISYSYQPFASDQLGVATRFLSVTGNVYQSDGTPPRFVCQGSDACETTARTRSAWAPASRAARCARPPAARAWCATSTRRWGPSAFQPSIERTARAGRVRIANS